MFQSIQRVVPTEKAMLDLGEVLASCCEVGDVIYLTGEIGSGKTTLIRGFLRELGYNGFVKSPSYTLIEIYKLKVFHVVHVDLYRLVDTEEYWNIGLYDYLEKDSIILIEWPERAEGFLPLPTFHVNIDIDIKTNKRFVNLDIIPFRNFDKRPYQ
ncbi:tRNA (adenosine(37)-N6)-threonylcarbamoyltransferase complex ATPase subunit type 1 TsaE [Coxiella endosymbiont of Amblyomma nuttalli]|uniref:tRNA (adenosine(37)-N6)-threonylcarbamoyltransferase complex ATPase subunit type 1 TsaE n=1 Tax=Coxiella endosymbiont of Amblyomma nuttalli TaxID=2749996 RepID=UPI001BABF20B|nr:tRNA (adenosine(37)-N6)-threonylcarbamoyltransferase complex ATPase subunit type 1 TsaE [Coxiella endosymbiont of Amblyomma nuttalli]QTS83940.1 tRNA threonylcarbamoyladenosine biosynthesis protein TsaE [Coxiella endosymbiont of Amblyomma nuttalli]